MSRRALVGTILLTVALLVGSSSPVGASSGGSFSTYLGGSAYEEILATATDGAGNVYVAGDTYSNDFPATPGAFQPTYAGGVDAFVAKLDPTGSRLIYATYLGGSDYEEATSIAVDASGSAYVTGWTSSDDYPTTPGAFQRDPKWQDAFVTKLSPDGSTLAYSTRLGGENSPGSSGGSDDYGMGIAVDAAGHAFVGGDTTTSKFPVTAGAYQTRFKGWYDGFVTELDPTGSSLVYSTYVGGTSFDYGLGLAIDGSGNAYLTGETESRDFPTKNPFQPGLRGFSDEYVTKLDPTGSTLVYSSYLGGSDVEGAVLIGGSIAVNSRGEALVAGMTRSKDFPVTAGVFQPTFGGGQYDGYVAKIAASGQSLAWASYLGGGQDDYGLSVAVGPRGTALVSGSTASRDFPLVGGVQRTYGGGSTDGFVAWVNATGTVLTMSSYLGGSGEDEAATVFRVGGGGLATAGDTDSRDFPTTPGVVQPNLAGDDDGFVVRLR